MISAEEGIKGIEQGRASYAYEMVQEAKNQLKTDAIKYKSYVKKIPMYIKTNGLGPTFAFVRSKDEHAYKLIYKQTEKWLKKKSLLKEEGELIEQLISLDSSEYRFTANEVLALFNWLRRFSEGLIEGDLTNEP